MFENRNAELSLKQYQKLVDYWVQSYGVRYFSELTNLGVLMEEVGEVARILTRMHGDQSFKDRNEEKELGDELADVLFVVTCLANQHGVDLARALQENLDKKTSRDAERHIKNPKLRRESGK